MLKQKNGKGGGKGHYNDIMSMTALDLSPDERKKYRTLEIIRARRKAQRAELARRRRRARYVARKAADLLRTEFGAEKVVVFGSLTNPGSFTRWSDIDIAASGIPPEHYFEAAGVVAELSVEFRIDLVDMENCPPALTEVIAKEGKTL